MSIQQGLISPPLSCRTYKSDQPRIRDNHKPVSAVDVFGAPPTTSSHHADQAQFEHRHHTIRSPVKKHDDNLSDADRAVRPLTPPMSKDVRHDEQSCDREDHTGRHRISSEGDHFEPLPSSSIFESAPADVRVMQSSASLASASKVVSLEVAWDGDRFETLNQGVAFESDDEHNPFLDRRLPAAGSSSEVSKVVATAPAHAHHSHPYYDEFDSDQDAEGSVHEDDRSHDLRGDTTPKASSSNVTTPPPRAYAAVYRPARPLSTRIRVDNEPVTSVIPIRDTPRNPFLQGGPADNGFQGPKAQLAYRRAKQMPGKERGRINFVFRGQRVTYADLEYDSYDDDSDADDDRTKTNEFNPHHNPNRPPRLQPRLLFPPTSSNSSFAKSETATESTRSKAPVQSGAALDTGRRSNASSAYLPRAELAKDAFGGSTSSSSYEDEIHEHCTGGGLFAAQIAARRKQEMAAARVTAPNDSRNNTGRHHYAEQREYGETAAPSSSARLQNVTHRGHDATEWKTDVGGACVDGRQAARDALLARLEQTNWSDDEEDEHDTSYGRRRTRDGSEGTADEEEYAVESHNLPRPQSQRKRVSDELQAGHAEEVDVLGRPMKRSRASYAC